MINIKEKALKSLSIVLSNYKIISKKKINDMKEVNELTESSPTIKQMSETFVDLRSKSYFSSLNTIGVDAKEYLLENGLKYLFSNSLHLKGINDYYIIEHQILTYDYKKTPIVSITTEIKPKIFPDYKIFSTLEKALSNLEFCTYQEDINIYIDKKHIFHIHGFKNLKADNYSIKSTNIIDFFDIYSPNNLKNVPIKIVFYDNNPVYYEYYSDKLSLSDFFSTICLKQSEETIEWNLNSYLKYTFIKEIENLIDDDYSKVFLLENKD